MQLAPGLTCLNGWGILDSNISNCSPAWFSTIFLPAVSWLMSFALCFSMFRLQILFYIRLGLCRCKKKIFLLMGLMCRLYDTYFLTHHQYLVNILPFSLVSYLCLGLYEMVLLYFTLLIIISFCDYICFCVRLYFWSWLCAVACMLA